jgi:hypothetical protein
MSFLGTLEGIGAGDPMGSFLRSNTVALDQSANQAAGKALISMFSGQVPGAQSLGGPPVSSGMPPSIQPPTVPPMPPGGPQPYAQAGPPQSMVPGAQAMPPTPTLPGAPQGQQGAGPPAGPGNPPPGTGTFMGPQGSQPNPQLVEQMQKRALLQAKLQQLQGKQGGGGMPQAPQPGPQAPQRPQSGPVQGPQMQPPGGQAQIPPQLQQLAQGVQQAQGQLTWQALVQGVVKANPGASPQVIAGAVQKLIPLMQADSLQQWRQIQAQLGAGRLGESMYQHDQQNAFRQEQLGISQQNADTRGAAQQDTAEHRRETESQGQQHIEIAKGREERLSRNSLLKNDREYQKLELQKQTLEDRIKRENNKEKRAALIDQWRKTLEIQRTHANTVINSDKMLDDKKRKELLEDNDDWRKKQIRAMRRDIEGTMENRFQPAESMPPAIQQGQ